MNQSTGHDERIRLTLLPTNPGETSPDDLGLGSSAQPFRYAFGVASQGLNSMILMTLC